MAQTSAMAGWHDFFVAQAGVAGALIGLLFVAVSINLTRILQLPQLPTRAADTLAQFFAVLVVAAMALVPGQSDRALGCEVAGAAACAWAFELRGVVKTFAQDRGTPYVKSRLVLNLVPPLPYLVAGVGLAVGYAGAPIWFLPGTLACFAAGVAGAWVLLIEIQR